MNELKSPLTHRLNLKERVLYSMAGEYICAMGDGVARNRPAKFNTIRFSSPSPGEVK